MSNEIGIMKFIPCNNVFTINVFVGYAFYAFYCNLQFYSWDNGNKA